MSASLEIRLKLANNHMSFLKRKILLLKRKLGEHETKLIGAERHVQQLEIEIRKEGAI